METVVAIKLGETTIKQEILDIGEVHDEVEPVVPIKLEEGATIKQGFRDMDASRRTLSVANSAVFVCHHCGCEGKSLEDMRRHMRRHRGLSVGDKVSRVEEVKRDTSMCRGQGEASRPKDVKRGHNEILDIGEVYEEVEPIKLEKVSNVKQETLDIKQVYDEVEHAAPIKLDEAVFKQEILDITEIYDDLSPIKDEHCSDDDAGFRDLDASSKTISVAYSAVFVCHHCGCEGKSLKVMRRHMRRHRGLSVGDQVSRVEVRRDTSMCRGLGEATKFSNLKMRTTDRSAPSVCNELDWVDKTPTGVRSDLAHPRGSPASWLWAYLTSSSH
ncbi:hypothetical protein AAG570_007409 [Ranatra chinensis]|uniref:C2H2-type domain-containing protein n=1 Tax=Ranatra chinensis TaxID=642074 RepID=A0ABD0YHK6_9HEMI